MSRRSHPKSRSGCRTCKKRKIKVCTCPRFSCSHSPAFLISNSHVSWLGVVTVPMRDARACVRILRDTSRYAEAQDA